MSVPVVLRAASTAALVVAVAGVAAPASSASAATAPADLYPCRGFGGLSMMNPVPEVDQDYFTWSPYRKVKVGNGRHDIDWRLDPYRQDSWRTHFHSLKWAGRYIEKSTAIQLSWRDPSAVQGAVAIAADWVKDNPYPWPTGPGAGNATHGRTDTLLCLRGALVKTGRPVPRWLDTTLLQHADWLKKHTWSDHNVGTDQTLAVMGVGCALGRTDLRDYAVSRLSREITRVIDAQGANNEQSIGYARYNYGLWGYADQAIARCAGSSPAARTISSRRAALLGFLDHAMKPDGSFQQIGDTQDVRPALESATPAQRWILTDGRDGRPPRERVKIYDAGYVFGRSGWGTGARRPSQESAYAVRFGPTRVGHGHSDHTAVTWHTLGRPILVDSGTGSYNADAWRFHYIGPTAHNALVPAGMGNGSFTRLVTARTTAGADFYRLTDTPLPRTTRTRSVIVLGDPDVLLVADRAGAPKPTAFTQYWHLPADVSVRRAGTKATAVRGGVTTTLLQLPAAGVKPVAFSSVRGSTSPILGWQWPTYFTRRPAPVVTATQKGRSASMVTAVVASRGSAPVFVRPSITGTTTTYTIGVGPERAVVTLDGSGTFTRIR